jgi:hypothetical protein
MPGIKEARGFFYSLLLIGTLVIISSLYSTVWAAPSSGVYTETPAPVAVPAGGAIKAFTPGAVTSLISPDSRVTITIPASSPKEAGFLLYTPKDQGDVPASAPAGLAFSSALFDLTAMDTNGVVGTGNTFQAPIQVSVQYTDADIQAAEGNPGRLVLYKYDTAMANWSPLTTSVDFVNKTVQTSVSSLSFFALLGQPLPPTPTPTPTATLRPGLPTPTPTDAPPTATLLPPTPGDIAPGSGLLMGLLIAAFIMIAAGSYYLRQTKQS